MVPGLRQLMPTFACIQQLGHDSLENLRQDQLPAPAQPQPPALPTDAAAAGKYKLYVLLNNSLSTLTRMVESDGESRPESAIGLRPY